MKKTIYYDATFSYGNSRGMGRYLTNILDVLQSEFNLIALYPNSSKFENLPSNAIKFGFSNYFLWEQISLPIFIFKNKFDIFIYPYNTCSIFFPSKAKKIIIVHDLIFFQKYKTPTFKQKIGKIYRRLITPIAIKTADKIITVSEFSRMIIKKKFTDKNIAVTVIPNTFKINQINCNIDYKSRKNYFLTISGESGHKNIERLIESFSIFKNQLNLNDISLVVIGINNIKYREILFRFSKKFGIYDNIIFLEYQSEDSLIELYKNAKGLIFASIYEGFGIPLLEAMIYNTPIICSNNSSFPEIAKNSAFYFDPFSVYSISNAINLAYNNTEFCENKMKEYDRILKLYNFNSFSIKVKNFFADI